MELKSYVQYQKPQAFVLYALALPALTGVYNFGWRAAVMIIVAMFTCWATEYAFTRKENKPASQAALVTGALLALVCPPNLPFWQIIVGSVFCIVFGKMVFGGFGRNVFNPAMVGRCFLYISFPLTMAAAWYVPFQGLPAGFTTWTSETRAKDIDASLYSVDAVTSATVLSATKRQGKRALEAKARGDQAAVDKLTAAFQDVSWSRLLTGNLNGCIGETNKIAILLAMAFLLYSGIAAAPLMFGPLIGMILTKIALNLLGFEILPLGQSLFIAIFGGGTLFACAFMTTEPVTAPLNTKARWAYGVFIGITATVIRSQSAFNAGFMFAILLGNTFGPIIEIGIERWEKSRKAVTA